MNEPTSLGLLLKRYRVAAGLSQEALAQRADLSARAISDLERGLHRAPRSATLDLLATALSLSSQQRSLLLAAARPELVGEAQGSVSDVSLLRPGLPSPPTALIGRESECAYALSLWRRDATRLLTLTGPSGVGKTRLAIQIAHELSPMFRDGAVFVDLAPASDATLVPGVLAQALHLREDGHTPLDEQVRTHLRDKHLLFLLDNFEHVIGAALFVADLLAWCPRASFLVTSRTPLRLRGEQTLPLAPLPLEDAIVLLRERVHAMRPASPLAVSDAAAVCEWVDCLPLAIELVAGQAAMLSLPQVLERLNQHMALVLEGARDLPVRQHTMDAAIGWSYDLLTADQQRCFRALGVFVGGFTLASARAVCWGDHGSATEAETLLALAALVDASLLQVEIAPGGSARFRMLALVRTFALDRLRAEGEEDECRRRHATYFASMADALMCSGFGVNSEVSALSKELPNARAALEWAGERRDAELGLRLTGFARLWDIAGMIGEADHWLRKMLALDAEARATGAPAAPLFLRVARLYGYARVLLNHGTIEQAEEMAQESVQLAQQTDDQHGLSEALTTLGLIAQAQGDVERAASAFNDSLKASGTDHPSQSKYRAIYLLAELARLEGDFARAHALLTRALDGAQAARNEWDSAVVMTMLGHVERLQGNTVQAREHYLESLAHFHAFGSPAFFAWCLEGYAALLCTEGSHAQAVRLCAAAATLRQRANAPLPDAELDAFERTLERARESLGEAGFSSEWIVGSSLSDAAALADALGQLGPRETSGTT